MEGKINIAIDGYSSCGKSTLAKDLSRELGYLYLDSGAMYRAVTWYFLQKKIDLNNAYQISGALAEIQVSFSVFADKRHTLLNGEDVEDKIRGMQVAEFVSPVAAIPDVRRAMVRQQQFLAKDKGVVMDGRDIGTVVLPGAELKIFVTADPVIRALRRYNELKAKGINIELAEVKKNLIKRDTLDSTREHSPLRKADDARIIDNSNLNRPQQLAIALQWAREAISGV